MVMSAAPKPEHVKSPDYLRWLRSTVLHCELCWYERRTPCSAKREAHHLLARGRHGDDRVSNIIILGGGLRGCHALVGREGISTERLQAALGERLARWHKNGMLAQVIARFPGLVV